MNIDNIKATIKTMRAHKGHFNMSDWFDFNGLEDDDNKHLEIPLGEAINHCGTSACIAGFAVLTANPKKSWMETYSIPDDAAEFFELDSYTARRIFQPDAIPHPSDPESCRWYQPLLINQVSDAIPVLEHLITTGEIDWTKSPAYERFLQGEDL